MNAKELAESLNGREYLEEITRNEKQAARAAGLVVVLGRSDDVVELNGAIEDEAGACGGGTVYLTETGILANKCSEIDCPYHQKLKEKAATINAYWEKDGFSWTFSTSIPHETFVIMRDGITYCRGFVFALSDANPSNAVSATSAK